MKTVPLQRAVEMIPSGASVMIGGFLGVGTPEAIIDELVRQTKSDLIIIANDAASPLCGVGKLVQAGLVRRLIVSQIGFDPETQKSMLNGVMEVDLVPQDTLAERIRAAGFGLGGVLTPTGIGTDAEKGKPTLEIDGKRFLVETALHADFALLQAFMADAVGNLSYALSAGNLNPLMAMAAKTVIVETENIVPVGVIAPDHVMTPGPLIDYVVSND